MVEQGGAYTAYNCWYIFRLAGMCMRHTETTTAEQRATQQNAFYNHSSRNCDKVKIIIILIIISKKYKCFIFLFAFMLANILNALGILGPNPTKMFHELKWVNCYENAEMFEMLDSLCSFLVLESTFQNREIQPRSQTMVGVKTVIFVWFGG